MNIKTIIFTFLLISTLVGCKLRNIAPYPFPVETNYTVPDDKSELLSFLNDSVYWYGGYKPKYIDQSCEFYEDHWINLLGEKRSYSQMKHAYKIQERVVLAYDQSTESDPNNARGCYLSTEATSLENRQVEFSKIVSSLVKLGMPRETLTM